MTHIGMPRRLGVDPVIMPLNIDCWLCCFPLSTDRFFLFICRRMPYEVQIRVLLSI